MPDANITTPEIKQPEMVQDQWEPSMNDASDFANTSAPPAWLHENVSRSLNENADPYDLAEAVKNPATPEKTLDLIHSHFKNNPDDSESFSDRPMTALLEHPKAKVEWARDILDRKRAGEDIHGGHLRAAMKHKEITQNELNDLVGSSMQNPKDRAQLDASRTDPSFLLEQHKQLDSQSDSGDQPWGDSKKEHYLQEIANHPGHTPETLEATRKLLMNHSGGYANAQNFLENQKGLNHNQIEEFYNHHQPKAVEERDDRQLAETAFNHPNVDPSFIASRATAGSDGERSAALESEKLPHENQLKAMNEGFANPDIDDHYHLANNPNLPPDIASRLLEAHGPHVLGGKYLNHPNLPEQAIAQAWENSAKTPKDAKAFLARKTLPTKVLSDIVTSGKPADAAKAVNHPSADQSLIDLASQRKAKDVQAAVAKHPLGQEKHLGNHILSGKMPASEYINEHDEKVSPEVQIKAHQMFANKISDPKNADYSDSNQNASAYWLYHSPHVSDEQKEALVNRSLSQNKDMTNSLAWHSTNLKAHAKLLTDAADEGNVEAGKAVLTNPKLFTNADLDEAQNPKFLNSAVNMATHPDAIRNDGIQGQLAGALLSNPNLETEQVKKLIDTHGHKLMTEISKGHLLPHLHGKTPEERHAFFQDLSTTPNGKLATLVSPESPADLKAHAINSMNTEELINFTKNAPENSVISAFRTLPVDQRIAMVKGSHNDNLYGDNNAVPATALHTLTPEEAPLSSILNGSKSEDVSNIIKNLPDSYSGVHDPKADAIMVNQHPEALPAYNLYSMGRGDAATHFFHDRIMPHLNEDNAYAALNSLMSSKNFTGTVDDVDAIADSAKTPYLSDAARANLVVRAMHKRLLSPYWTAESFNLPGVGKELLDSDNLISDKQKLNIINDMVSKPNVDPEDFTAAIDAVKRRGLLAESPNKEEDKVFDGMINHAFNHHNQNTADDISTIVSAYTSGKKADKVVKTLGDIFHKVNSSSLPPEAKHKIIIDSYNKSLELAAIGQYGPIAYGLAEPVADSIMANNDLSELFKQGTNGTASSPIFIDAMNKIASEPQLLNPDDLNSLYSNILQSSGNANLTSQNFAKVLDAGIDSGNKDIQESAGAVLSKGIEYSGKMDPENFDSMVKTGFKKMHSLPPEVKDRVAVSIATSTASPGDRLRALHLISDQANRQVNINKDILNSDDMIAKARTAPWAATQLTNRFKELSPEFQDKAADSIADGMLNSNADEHTRSSVVSHIISKAGSTISSTAVKKLFSPLNFDSQTSVLSNMPGSEFGSYSAISDQYLANAKLSAYQNIDPNTGQENLDPTKTLDAIQAMRMLLPKADNFGDADKSAVINMQNESAKMIDHLLNRKDLDINQNSALIEHLGGLLTSNFSKEHLDAATLNKTISSALAKGAEGEVRISPALERHMIRYQGIDNKNIESLATSQPAIIAHLASNPNMDANKIDIINKVLTDSNIKKLDDTTLKIIASNMMKGAQATGTSHQALNVAIRSLKHTDESARDQFLVDLAPLDSDNVQYMLDTGFATPTMLAESNHGGKKVYEQFLKNHTPTFNSIICNNDHFDDRGADKIIQHSSENDVGENVRFMLQNSSGKLSKQKFDEICEKFPSVVKENPDVICKSPHLDFNSIQNLHKQIAPDYSKFIERGNNFAPTYINVKYGAKVFRENYPQTLPEKIDNINSRKLLKSQSSRNGADRLQQAMAVIPPQGVAWGEFKKANKQMESWPEVKALFMSKNNKPVMPEDIAQAIAKIPEQQYHITYDSWEGVQRHNDKKNLVVQLNTGESFDKTLGEDPKLWNFYQMVQQSANGTNGQGSSHPVTPHTVGWVRIDTSSPEHFMVEEFQSDFNQKLKKHIKAAFEKNPKGTVSFGGQSYTHEEADEYIDKIEKAFEGWMPTAYQAVEALAKKQGVKKIFVHGVGVRKQLSGVSPEQHVATFDEAYKKQPQKMGYQQCNYSDYPSFNPDIQNKNIDKKCWVKDIS
jgi:hypothetical protein